MVLVLPLLQLRCTHLLSSVDMCSIKTSSRSSSNISVNSNKYSINKIKDRKVAQECGACFDIDLSEIISLPADILASH